MKRSRNPKATRRAILDAAFERIHTHGFRASGLNDILSDTGVTKGALYHHFPSKMALGYALVEETLKDHLEEWWLDPLRGVEDPIEALAQSIQRRLSTGRDDVVGLGCPLNNLVQEMSPVDKGFRQRLDNLYRLWRKGVARALRNGQQHGHVRGDLDTEQASAFIVAALEGAFGQAKAAQSLDVFQDCMGGLGHYLSSLRP